MRVMNKNEIIQRRDIQLEQAFNFQNKANNFAKNHKFVQKIPGAGNILKNVADKPV